jgi:hypothetical protein
MAIEFNGTTDRIDYANIFDWGSTPFTWAAWLWWDSFTASAYYMCDHITGNVFGIIFVVPAGDNSIQQTTLATGNDQVSRTTIGGGYATTGSWIHAAFSWNGAVGNPATDTIIYKNGSVVALDAGAAATGTGTPEPLVGLNSLGGRFNDDLRNFDGRMAEVGRWTRQLNAAEIAALAKGYSPRRIPNGLKWYTPLIRNINNQYGSVGTADGTTVIAHPTFIIP